MFLHCKGLEKGQFQPVGSSFDYLRIFPYVVNLQFFHVNLTAVDIEQVNDMFPGRTLVKVFEYCTFLVRPSVFFGSIEQCRFCFPDV